MVSRTIQEGVQIQGVDESILYTVTTTNWTNNPVNPVVVVYDTTDETSWVDVTATVTVGSPSVDGDVITLPAIEGLTAGVTYRVEVKFEAGGNVFETYFWIKAEQ